MKAPDGHIPSIGYGPETIVKELSEQELVNHMKDALAAHFLRSGDGEVESFRVTGIFRRPFSSVRLLETRVAAVTRRLVMKTSGHNPVHSGAVYAGNQAVVEYRLLEEMAPKFDSVPGCSVPRPVLLVPEIETFVMEYVDGSILSESFRYANYLTAKSKFRRLSECLHLCGTWLRHFHEFTGSRRAGVEAFETTLERCRYRIQVLQDGGSRCWPRELGAKILRCLEDQMNILGQEDILVTGRHGDFGPWNIIRNDRGICVIDFFGYRLDLTPIDYLKMCLFLEDSKKDIACNPLRMDELKRRFADGYGEFPKVPEPIVNICEILHRVCSVFGCITNVDGRLIRRVEMKRRLNENLTWLSKVSADNSFPSRGGVSCR